MLKARGYSVIPGARCSSAVACFVNTRSIKRYICTQTMIFNTMRYDATLQCMKFWLSCMEIPRSWWHDTRLMNACVRREHTFYAAFVDALVFLHDNSMMSWWISMIPVDTMHPRHHDFVWCAGFVELLHCTALISAQYCKCRWHTWRLQQCPKRITDI